MAPSSAPRLDQLEHPWECRLGGAAQRSARGGEMRAVRKVGHGRRSAGEGAKVGHLLGTQSALLERQLLGVLGQISSANEIVWECFAVVSLTLASASATYCDIAVATA